MAGEQRTLEPLLCAQINLLRLRNLLQDVLDDDSIVLPNISVKIKRCTLIISS